MSFAGSFAFGISIGLPLFGLKIRCGVFWTSVDVLIGVFVLFANLFSFNVGSVGDGFDFELCNKPFLGGSSSTAILTPLSASI